MWGLLRAWNLLDQAKGLLFLFNLANIKSPAYMTLSYVDDDQFIWIVDCNFFVLMAGNFFVLMADARTLWN